MDYPKDKTVFILLVKGLLHIRRISDAGKYREGPVKGFSSIVKEIMAELKSPSRFRMIAGAIPDVYRRPNGS